MSEHTENSAGPGHNGGISPDVMMALGFHHKAEYEKALKAKKEADARLKVVAKTALANGISVSDIKTMIRLDTPEGEAAIREEIQRTIEVARWMEAEIGTQLDLLDIPDRRPVNEKAYADGKTSGMKGETLRAPDGEAGQFFAQGWHVGQAALMEALELTKAGMAELAGENAGATVITGEEAVKRKRGRPRKVPTDAPSPPAVAGDDDPFDAPGTPLH